MKKIRKISLGIKFTFITLLMCFSIGALVVASSYQLYSQQIIKKYEKSSEAAVEAVMNVISAEEIRNYYDTGKKDANYDNYLEKIRICGDACDARYLYIVVPTQTAHIFIFDSDRDSRGHFNLGEPTPYDEGIDDLVEEMVRGDEINPVVTDDEYGLLLTTYTPIFDDAGKFVAYICVDYSALRFVEQQEHFISQLTLATIAMSIILTALFYMFIRRFLIRPINQIADAASNYLIDTSEAISQTNSITELDIRSRDELKSLSMSLKTMEQKIQNYLKNLEEANRKAETDLMTGLLNREAFEKRIVWSLENERGNNFNAFMMIDLDYFKNINDTYGHAIGDEVIIACTQAIRSCFRSTDFISRMGGDEFAVFFKTPASVEEVESRAEKVCDAIRQLRIRDEISITVSLGIAVSHSRERQEYQTLYLAADNALYETKEKGRNGFTIAQIEVRS